MHTLAQVSHFSLLQLSNPPLPTLQPKTNLLRHSTPAVAMIPLLHTRRREKLPPQPLRIQKPLPCDLRIRRAQLTAIPAAHIAQHRHRTGIPPPPREHLRVQGLLVFTGAEQAQELVLEVADVGLGVGSFAGCGGGPQRAEEESGAQRGEGEGPAAHGDDAEGLHVEVGLEGVDRGGAADLQEGVPLVLVEAEARLHEQAGEEADDEALVDAKGEVFDSFLDGAAFLLVGQAGEGLFVDDAHGGDGVDAAGKGRAVGGRGAAGVFVLRGDGVLAEGVHAVDVSEVGGAGGGVGGRGVFGVERGRPPEAHGQLGFLPEDGPPEFASAAGVSFAGAEVDVDIVVGRLEADAFGHSGDHADYGPCGFGLEVILEDSRDQ